MENPRGGCGRWSRTLVWHREACVCDEIRVRRMWAIIGEGGSMLMLLHSLMSSAIAKRSCQFIAQSAFIVSGSTAHDELWLWINNYTYVCVCVCVLRNCWGICWLVCKIMDGIGECGNVARDNTPDYLSPPRNSMRNGSNVAFTASADTGGIWEFEFNRMLRYVWPTSVCLRMMWSELGGGG